MFVLEFGVLISRGKGNPSYRGGNLQGAELISTFDECVKEFQNSGNGIKMIASSKNIFPSVPLKVQPVC